MATISGEVRDDAGDLVADVVVRAYRRDTGALLVSGLSGDGSPEETGDPDYASVSLLLHCDGTNGSTTFTDSSGNSYAVTAYGDAKISTAQSVFGGASAYFDSTGDYLYGASWLAAGQFGTGDFTVECWVYATGAANSNQVIWSANAQPATTGIYLAYSNGTATGLFVKAGAGLIIASSAGWSYDVWHHLAVVRSGTMLYLFIDGINRGSATWTNNCSDGMRHIGRPNDVNNYNMNGYIDEFRITKGVARYTANFTAPTEAFLLGTIPAKPVGEYTLTTSYTDEVQVIALDPAGGTTFNDLILRTTPV